jgi:hypothetical protein
MADGDGDNVIDTGEYGVWKARVGKTAGRGSVIETAISEPSASSPFLLTFSSLPLFHSRPVGPPLSRATALIPPRIAPLRRITSC